MIQEKLKNLRKQKGLSQEMMAKILSTDTSNYSRKERGETRIHDDEWKKLAEALDVPVEVIKEENNNFSGNLDNLMHNDHAIVGNVNCYNIPSFIIDSLQDYVSMLKEQNELLKNKVIELSSKLK
ncbi:helix-turn-helix domain-containing protein [Chryseobacterium herbae]|uniref:Helix-turn-helix domain-containing protein n=1 Tax=Chryseobacterium herbae TaxID=2976476 RepID=A0ABT2IWI3_9FLAO|nr:helix-turn-helix domain-containing protein [Chryseobacterium sp. pc1-10]MCT2562841.1 helix-turn-helix domain-containing protein [Chryseobacterium sp. pc1-10]